MQIARARDAYVIGTASAAKHDFVRGLGADEVIDYRTQDFTGETGDLDVVLDTICGDYGPRSRGLLNPGGTYIALAAPTDEDFLLVEPDHASVRALAHMVETKMLTVTVDSVFPLADAAKAHEHSEKNGSTGKIVLTVDQRRPTVDLAALDRAHVWHPLPGAGQGIRGPGRTHDPCHVRRAHPRARRPARHQVRGDHAGPAPAQPHNRSPATPRSSSPPGIWPPTPVSPRSPAAPAPASRANTPVRTGNRKLKRAFFLAGFAALHDPTSRAYHDRKRAEGKKHNAALIWLARGRCDVLYATLRNGTHYRHPESSLCSCGLTTTVRHPSGRAPVVSWSDMVEGTRIAGCADTWCQATPGST